MADFKWTPKREVFCTEFLIDLNGAGAARRAGYSERSAAELAHDLLQMPDIRDRIQDLMNDRATRVRITADDVLRELKAIMLADPNDAYNDDGTMKPMKEIPQALRRCIAGVKTDELFDGTGDDRVWTGYTREIKWWSKDKAIENAMKHLKLIGGDINIQIGLADTLADARARVKRITVLGRAAPDTPELDHDDDPEVQASADAG